MRTELPLAAEELLAQVDWIRGLARSLVRADDADDLVQDTLVATLPARRPTGVALRPWLATVASNLARNRFRAADRREGRERSAARPERTGDSADLVERAELLKRVVDRLLALPDLQREAVYLRYVEGLRPADIADRVGVPASTVRTRIHDGLARMRRDLDAEHGGDRRRWCALLAPVALAPPGGMEQLGRVARAPARSLPAVTPLKVAASLAVAASLVALPTLWPFAAAESEPSIETARATSSDSPRPAARLASAAAPTENQRRPVPPPPLGAGPGVDAGRVSGSPIRVQLVQGRSGEPLAGMSVQVLHFGPVDLGAAPGLLDDLGPASGQLEDLGAASGPLAGLGYASGPVAPTVVATGRTDADGRFESEERFPPGSYMIELFAVRKGGLEAARLLGDGPLAPARFDGDTRRSLDHGTASGEARLEFAIGSPWHVEELVADDAGDTRWFCGRIASSGEHPFNGLTQAVPGSGRAVWPSTWHGPEDPSIPAVFDEQGLWCWEGAPFGDYENVRPEARARVDARLRIQSPSGGELHGRVRLTDGDGEVVLEELLSGLVPDGWTDLPLRWLEPGRYDLRLDVTDHEVLERELRVSTGRSQLDLELAALPAQGLGELEVVIESRAGTIGHPLALSVFSSQGPPIAGGQPILRRELETDGAQTRIQLEGLHRREYLVRLHGPPPSDPQHVGIPEPLRRVRADGRTVRFELLDDVPRRDLEFRVVGPGGGALSASVWLFSSELGTMYANVDAEDGRIRLASQPMTPGLSAFVMARGHQGRQLELTDEHVGREGPIEVRLEPGFTLVANAERFDPDENWLAREPITDARFYAGDRLVGTAGSSGLALLTFPSAPETLRATSDIHGELGHAPDDVLETETAIWWIQRR